MKIRKVRKDGINEIGCLIVDDNGVPIDRICRYTLVELRGLADNTQENSARHVIHIENWAQRLSIDLEEEIALNGLSRNELFISLINHLERYADTQDDVKPIRPRIVEPEYFNQRINECIRYFEFIAQRAISKRQSNDPMIRDIQNRIIKISSRLKRRIRPVEKSSSVLGLSRLMQSTLYKCLSNPNFFGWNQYTQLRNNLIIRLFYETGIRKGELLSLTIENCHTSKLTLNERPYIHTMENVKYEDPRSVVPHEKTRGRIIPISNDLAKLIEEYKFIRNKSDSAKKQKPFLILSSQEPHKPLSLSALNGIFESIKNHIPELGKFGPHRLRHTFFENLDRMMQTKRYDNNLKKKIKNTIGGWSPSSNQSKDYEVLATLEQCIEALSIYHQELEMNNGNYD